MMWYELCSAMYIRGLLKLFNYLDCFDLIFNICFAIRLIPLDQFLFLQVIQDIQNLFLSKFVRLGVFYHFRLRALRIGIFLTSHAPHIYDSAKDLFLLHIQVFFSQNIADQFKSSSDYVNVYPN